MSLFIRIGVLVFAATRFMSLSLNQNEEIHSTISNLPHDTQINFLDTSNYDFMIGFNQLFTPKHGKFVITLDNYLEGRLIS